MAIHIELPAEIEKELRRETPNLDENAREQFLICKYREGKLSTADLAQILGLETRLDAQRWLAERGVPLNYSLADLEQDRKNLEELFGPE